MDVVSTIPTLFELIVTNKLFACIINGEEYVFLKKATYFFTDSGTKYLEQINVSYICVLF